MTRGGISLSVLIKFTVKRIQRRNAKSRGSKRDIHLLDQNSLLTLVRCLICDSVTQDNRKRYGPNSKLERCHRQPSERRK